MHQIEWRVSKSHISRQKECLSFVWQGQPSTCWFIDQMRWTSTQSWPSFSLPSSIHSIWITNTLILFVMRIYSFKIWKETKRAYLTPSRVENLLVIFWDRGQIVHENMDSIAKVKERVTTQLNNLRNDHKRMLNPTPYKVFYLTY